ncbi:MAG: hypothetical protein K2N82_05055 [Lachnospiraceae bacterium]|nr:hypothetical protein [Lachnospiraceae bacterium]
MTALKREAITLVEQLPEEQMPYVIQYIHGLRSKNIGTEKILDSEPLVTPKMAAFLELEKMICPISPELNYDQELAEARDEKYGYTD